MENIREIILDSLLSMEKEGEFDSVLVRRTLERHDGLPKREKAFIKRVTEGTVERLIELDYILNQFSSVPVPKMKPLVRALLRMSVYQLLYMDGVPDAAVCCEAAYLAQKRHFSTLKGFVNGVLRNVARKKGEITYPDPETDWAGAVSVRYSMPEFLVGLWERDYGRERTEGMCRALLLTKPVSLRISEALPQGRREELIQAWQAGGASCERHPYLPYAWNCRNVEGLHKLAGFAEGLVTVQDASSMLVTECAGVRRGDFVLDVCAAPGGKSLHAADKLRDGGRVEARDVSAEKVSILAENIARMRAGNVAVKVWDARCFNEAMEGKADVLYLDVPCSGLGVLGKKRDIKYHLTEEGLADLVKLQREIISACWRYVKPGGVILYSTCTVHLAENEDQVRWMCGAFPLALESLNPYLPEALRCAEAERGMLQLVPGVHECDGFFLARMRRSRPCPRRPTRAAREG